MIEVMSAAFAAGETKTFNIQAEYFELLDAPYPVDVLLLSRDGGQLSRLIGAEASYFTKPGRFETFTITSASAQTIRWFLGSGDAGTRKTAGVVQVVDGGKARTLANQAFAVAGSRAAVAAQFAVLQLVNSNPAGQKRLVVEQITMQAVNADILLMCHSGAALPTVIGTPRSKLGTGGVDANVTMRSDSIAALPPAGILSPPIFQANVPASGNYTFTPTPPIILPPGSTLTIAASAASNTIGAAFEYYTEPEA